MHIGEIPINETVQIRVTRGVKRYEVDAIVVATKEDTIYTSLIKHEGQVIDFNSDKVQILCFYVRNGSEPIGFSGVRIKRGLFQGKDCHAITTKRESVRVNRRSTKRIRTEMNGLFRTMASEREMEMVIRNYSLGGLCFRSRADVDQKDFALCTAIVEDKVKHMRVVLKIRILRKKPLKEKRFEYAAKLMGVNDDWTDYVSDKIQDLLEKSKEQINTDE